MPDIPDFPSPAEEEDDDGRKPERGGIVDRIIGDGNWPVGDDPLPDPTPSR